MKRMLMLFLSVLILMNLAVPDVKTVQADVEYENISYNLGVDPGNPFPADTSKGYRICIDEDEFFQISGIVGIYKTEDVERQYNQIGLENPMGFAVEQDAVDTEMNSVSFFILPVNSGTFVFVLMGMDNQEHLFYFQIGNSSGGDSGGESGGNELYTFQYNGVNYKVGAANGSSDGQTLHIDDGGVHDYTGEDFTQEFFIGVGVLDGNDNLSGSAPQSVIDMVNQNLTVSSSSEYISNIVIENDLYHFNDKTVPGGVDYKKCHFTVSGDLIGTVEMTISFSLDSDGDGETENYSVSFDVIVLQTEYLDYSVDSLTGSDPQYDIIRLNEILGSKTALENFVNQSLDSNNVVRFNFTPGTFYPGKITVNCEHPVEFNTTGLDSGWGNQDKATSVNNYIAIYDESIIKATIQGGIVNKCGLSAVTNLNFIADSNYKYGLGEGYITVGIAINSFPFDGELSSDPFNPNKLGDLSKILGCSFTGYDYAIFSDVYGLASAINYCKFTNNQTAILVDSEMNMSYGDSCRNTFVNNGTAIEIKRVPNNCIPMQFVFAKNYFFGSGTDYKVNGDAKRGSYFFIDSYYGTDYSEGFTDDNVRSSRVDYGQGSVAEIVTGPCIRYPEQNNILGFDVGSGASNKIYNGQNMSIHVDDLRNSQNEVNIDIFDSMSESDLGTLHFGGNN